MRCTYPVWWLAEELVATSLLAGCGYSDDQRTRYLKGSFFAIVFRALSLTNVCAKNLTCMYGWFLFSRYYVKVERRRSNMTKVRRLLPHQV